MQVRQFILSREGEWLDMGWFVRMPVDERRQMFMFATVVEVMAIMEELIGPVRVMRSKPSLDEESEPEDDGVQGMINDSV